MLCVCVCVGVCGVCDCICVCVCFFFQCTVVVRNNWANRRRTPSCVDSGVVGMYSDSFLLL